MTDFIKSRANSMKSLSGMTAINLFLKWYQWQCPQQKALVGNQSSPQARKVPGEVPCKHDNKELNLPILWTGRGQKNKALIKHEEEEPTTHTHTHK